MFYVNNQDINYKVHDDNKSQHIIDHVLSGEAGNGLIS